MASVYVGYEHRDQMLVGALVLDLCEQKVPYFDAQSLDASGQTVDVLSTLKKCDKYLLVGSLVTVSSSRRLSFELGVALGRRMKVHWVAPIEDRDDAAGLCGGEIEFHFINFARSLRIDPTIRWQLLLDLQIRRQLGVSRHAAGAFC